MRTVAAAAAAAGVLTYAGLLLIHPLLRRHALAHPTARSSHRVPTPQGGGVAVMVSTLAAASTAARVIPGAAAGLLPVGTAAAALVVVGVLDDLRSLHPGARLAAQFALAVIPVLALPDELRLLPDLALWTERALVVVALVWFINLFNFMDGLDWMTVVTTVPITGAIWFIGLVRPLPFEAVVVAAALCGASAGFAPFNRPVASLFLGDAGSLPMGLTVGWLLLVVALHGYPAAAVLLPLYYLTDTGLTLLRRLARGERVWEAHRTHYYQRASARGLSVVQIVGRVFAVHAALAALAIATVLVDSNSWAIVCLGAGAAIVASLLVSFGRGTS